MDPQNNSPKSFSKNDVQVQAKNENKQNQNNTINNEEHNNKYLTKRTEDINNTDSKENYQSNKEYATFFQRLLAYGVDYLVISCISFFISILFGTDIFSVFRADTMQDLQEIDKYTNLTMFIGFLLAAFYYIIVWTKFNGQSVGKKVMAIRIERNDGKQMNLSTSFFRYLGYLASYITLGLGFLWMIWDKKNEGFQDKIASTRVYKTSDKPKTFVAILLTVIALILYCGVITASSIKGFSIGYNEARDEYSKEQEGNIDTGDLQSDVFEIINQERIGSGMEPLIEDQKLCAYTSRRLDQLTSLGSYDDGRGFYEDLANPSISNAYFTNFNVIGTNAIILFDDFITGKDVVDIWTGSDESIVMMAKNTHGCVRANNDYVVVVVADEKVQADQ